MNIFKPYFGALLLIVLTTFSCTENGENKETEKESTPGNSMEKTVEAPVLANPFVAKVQKAHQSEAFKKQDAIKFDIAITFGGNQIFEAIITQQTDSRNALIEYKNGEKLYVNDDKVFVSAGLKENPGVRFHAYTWSYFFLFPHKMSDNGTIWTNYENNQLGESTYDTQKLTFVDGTGDAPKDWYIAYADSPTGVLNYAAYIVTANSTQEEAEKDPHAIEYADYVEVDGIPVAKSWKFWGWTTEKGLTDQIGFANLDNLSFVNTDDNTFKAPEEFTQR